MTGVARARDVDRIPAGGASPFARVGQSARVLLAVTLASLSGCTATDVTARHAGQRPADLSGDEAGLWSVVDRVETDIRDSGYRNEDPKLNDYVREVVCRVTGDHCDDLRIYVLDAPLFNAFMYPNGMMVVYSGLLLRAANEAQFACVIGHEFGHFLENHSLEQFRRARLTNKLVATLDLMLLDRKWGVVGLQVGIEGIGAPFAAALLSGYSRRAEREADRIGFEKAVAAGYRPAECAGIWTVLSDEIAASDSSSSGRTTAPFNIFSSHPLRSERIGTLTALAADQPDRGDVGEETYRHHTAGQLGTWLRADLSVGNFGRSLALHRNLLDDGRVPAGLVHYFSAEAYRLRNEAGDLARSIEAYARAAVSAGAPPETHREIAGAYRKAGRHDEAVDWYRRYLNEAADAPDRLLIESIISRLNDAKP